MLKLRQSVFDQIRRHGETAYPNECCGLLVGTVTAEGSVVARAIPVENATSGSARNSYEIAPTDLIRIQAQARRDGMEILGFYHSHPDHPAEPSTTDLAEAHWLGSLYVITAVGDGRAAATRSFYLDGRIEEDKFFREEEIRIVN